MTKKVFEALNWASSFLYDQDLSLKDEGISETKDFAGAENLEKAKFSLESLGSERMAAEILLCHHLGVNRSQMFAMFHDEIPIQKWEQFQEDVKQFAKGVPVQYLTGVEHFYGRVFLINEEVLIPRPETEEIVVGVLERLSKHFSKSETLDVADIGTGSGVIAVTLALENEQLRVIATDIAKPSLSVAQTNSDRLGANVRFLQGDLLQPLIDSGQKIDCLVSNPPYIPLADADTLHPRVRDYEPSRALFGGDDGLELYRLMIQDLPAVIKEKGIVAFEVGVGQAQTVAILLANVLPKARIEIINDINGKERMVFASW